MPDDEPGSTDGQPIKARIVRAGDGKDVGLGRVLLDSASSDGALGIIDMRARPGVVVPDHVHRDAEELFYVLEGELVVRIGDRDESVRSGDLVVVPRGTVHAHRNDADIPTRWLTLFSPAGTEGYFAERAHLGGAAPADVTVDYAGLEPPIHAQLRHRYGIEVVAKREES